jgi:hypothetical protein
VTKVRVKEQKKKEERRTRVIKKGKEGMKVSRVAELNTE